MWVFLTEILRELKSRLRLVVPQSLLREIYTLIVEVHLKVCPL